MQLTFTSIDMHNDKVEFTTGYSLDDGMIVFDDLSVNNTKIYLSILGKSLAFQRAGEVNTDLFLVENEITEGSYDGNGLAFRFKVLTKKLSIRINEIYVEYVMSLDNDIIGDNKIRIKLR